MELTKVIIRPYLTEKTYAKRSNDKKQYAFIVDIKANKDQIALAFFSIFNIEPEAVKTMVRKSVKTRTGTMHPGYTKAFKIAYITLPAGQDIALSKADTEAAVKGEKAEKAVKPAEAKEVKQEKLVDEDKKVETSDKKTAWRKQTNKNH